MAKKPTTPAMDVTIFHNPRCSKSRATLALLRERGIEPTVIEYLQAPPTAAELEELLGRLGLPPRALMRKGEAAYADSGAADEGLSRAQLIALMVQHPILIERPIVVRGGRAVLGRPPENVLDLLNGEPC